MENTNVTKETMMLKLMCDVFDAKAQTVATVLKSLPDAESDKLIELVMSSDSQEDLNRAVDLFQEALNKINA